MSKSPIARLSLDELESYLHEHRENALAGNPVQLVILHHTWQPTAADYAGEKTWQAIRRYHIETRGWREIGYHLGIAPDGTVWRLRPLTMTGAHCLGRYQGHRVNDVSIGLAMIGNFDVEDPELCLPLACQVMAIVCRVFGFGPGQIYFHRNFQDKSCPGLKVHRGDVRDRVAAILAGNQPEPPYPQSLDVAPWAEEAVKTLRDQGILSGYPDGSFRGGHPVTRNELAAALYKLLQHLQASPGGGER
ncbi:MAG: N-acetylmuramoyl-L-alanine amidase [Armatimonadetes bacterium]|nr:N-acetylmuramoyl-L-alanine amidase [Armatimonadota bacterium]